MELIGRLVARKQEAVGWKRVLLAGVGGCLVIALLALGSSGNQLVLLTAAFGSTCVLIFQMPAAHVAQPMNVLGGHLVSAFIGLLGLTFLPVTWWSVALCTGAAIAAMAALRVTHPPGGAHPITVMTTGATWWYLLTPIVMGSIAVLILGWAFHRATRTRYPI